MKPPTFVQLHYKTNITPILRSLFGGTEYFKSYVVHHKMSAHTTMHNNAAQQ